MYDYHCSNAADMGSVLSLMVVLGLALVVLWSSRRDR